MLPAVSALFQWLREHSELVAWLGVVSLVTLVGSALVVPVLVARLPVDYFVRPRRVRPASPRGATPRLLAAAKNALGGVLILAGVAMLVLPGQGVLTILVGLMLMDFPGKFAIERRLVGRPVVLRALNWIRRRAGVPPLEV